MSRFLTAEECFVWPFYFPTVVPPAPWKGRDEGCYLTLPLPLVKHQEDDEQIGPARDGADLAVVFEALNALQETPWQWNATIVELVRKARPEDKLPGLASDAEGAREERVSPEDAAFGERRAVESHGITSAMRLAILKRLEGDPEFWFPCQLDWRGRAYAVPALIHPQSDDLGRALIRFSRGKPLEERGAFWLAVHLANLWGRDGIDKQPFEKRVRWVEEHRDEIADSAARPLDGQRFWTRADKPWCFLAAVKEWAGYLAAGPSFVSHLAVAMDGTCNGLQHLSALGRDAEGGRWTNLVPSMEPHDIYQVVADCLKRTAGDMARHEELARTWLDLVDRRLVKEATMTTPYGVTDKGIHGQLVEQITTRFGGRFADVSKAAFYLGDMLKIAIDTVVVKAAEIRVWLRSVVRALARQDRGVSWVTPAGFPVKHEARRLPERRVETVLCSHVIYEGKGPKPMDVVQQENGIVPHLVHSLDAAHMMLTLCALKQRGLADFAMVHDSYAVHACDVDAMNAVLRDTFVEVHDRFTLAGFLADVRRAAPGVELPEPPALGALDLATVRSSEYFFS